MFRVNRLTLVFFTSLFSMPLAAYAQLSVEQALFQFNLIVLGDAKSSSHVDGRSFIAGNLIGGDYVLHPLDTPASAYAGLTVLGNASNANVIGFGATIGGNFSQSNVISGSGIVQGNASNINFGGVSAVGGTASTVNFNGGQYTGLAKTAAISNAMTIATSNDFDTLFTQASAHIATLSDTGGSVILSGNRATFNAHPNNGVAVFDLSAIDTSVFNKAEFDFNLNGASTVIFNSDEATINISANFLGGAAGNYGSKFLWNFKNATSINFGNLFGGSIIAPEAKLRNINNIEGSVVVGSLDQLGEFHLQPFTGTIPTPITPIPEPNTLAMFVASFVALWVTKNKQHVQV